MFSGFYTTNNGFQYITKSMEGKTLLLTKGQFGNGNLPAGTLVAGMTTLVSPLGEMQISKKRSEGNCITTTTQFSNNVNGTILSPFHLMEGGIFGKLLNADGTEAAPDTLLFYANALTTEVADYIPGVLTEFIINWPLTISESASVTVQIDRGLVYATLEDLDEWSPDVEGYEIASEEEAIAGADDTKIMTPYKVSLYVDEVLGDINTILDAINGKEI